MSWYANTTENRSSILAGTTPFSFRIRVSGDVPAWVDRPSSVSPVSSVRLRTSQAT